MLGFSNNEGDDSIYETNLRAAHACACLTRQPDIGPQTVKNHFLERGRFFVLRITFDGYITKLGRCAQLVALATEMCAEWSLAARTAPVGEIWCAQVERSRGHFASVGGKI